MERSTVCGRSWTVRIVLYYNVRYLYLPVCNKPAVGQHALDCVLYIIMLCIAYHRLLTCRFIVKVMFADRK